MEGLAAGVDHHGQRCEHGVQVSHNSDLLVHSAVIELDDLIEAVSCGVAMAAMRDFAVLIKAGQCRHGIGNDELKVGFFTPPVLTGCSACVCLDSG